MKNEHSEKQKECSAEGGSSQPSQATAAMLGCYPPSARASRHVARKWALEPFRRGGEASMYRRDGGWPAWDGDFFVTAELNYSSYKKIPIPRFIF